MNCLCHRLIGRRGSRRGHMGDEVRILFLTGFGDMHFVAGPPRLALFAIACFLVIGRVDELFARRQILIAAPVKLPLDPDVVLDPDAPQDLDCRDFTQPGRGIGCVDSRQQVRAISTDEFSHGLTLLLALWKARLLNPMPIAVKPLRGAQGQKPPSSDNGYAVECKAHGLADAHGCCHWRWWINRPALYRSTSGRFFVVRQSRQAFSSQSEAPSELFCGYLHPFPTT